MSSKVNQEFINFINQKKNKINKKNQTEEASTEQDAQDYKGFINKRKEKVKEQVTEEKVEKTESNQNDGSLKALLGMMSGKVIDKVVHIPEAKKEDADDEQDSNEESESESESDFEEEKINHYARGIEDIAQYNSESEDESIHEEKNKTFDNKEKRQVQCEVFAENIPFDKDEKFIVKFFKKLNNKIVKIKVLKDKDSGKSKGKAFIKFFNQEDAQDLMNKNLKIDKNQITLSMVKKFESNDGNQNQNGNVKKNKFEKKQEKKEKQIEKKKEQFIVNNNKTHTAFIRNLPLILEESTIIKHFKTFGKINNVRLMKNKDGKSKGFGYVDFEGQDGLENAVKNTTPIEIEGKSIFIEKAKSSFNENVYEDSKRLGKKKKRAEERNNKTEN